MNVDYVSKKFLKETGTKFSTYLADMRIKTAKQLLASKGLDKIQDLSLIHISKNWLGFR